MSRAQKIALAGLLMLRRLRQAKIELSPAVYQEYCRRVERWCAEAEINTASST